ncbi:MAG: hypothetical protein V1712_00675 [Patescibacteria group bacterium]
MTVVRQKQFLIQLSGIMDVVYLTNYNYVSDKWFVLKRNATLHHVVPISKSIVINLSKLLGVSFKRHVCVFSHNQQMDWYYDVEGIDSVAKIMLKKMSKQGFNEKIRKDWDANAARLNNLFDDIDKTKLGKLSNCHLASLYSKTISGLELESALGTLSDFLSSKLIEQEAHKYLKILKVPQKDFFRSTAVSMTSSHESPYTKEQIDFLRLAYRYNRGDDISQGLRLHSEKYWYIQNDYIFSTRLSPQYFKNQINKHLKEGNVPKNEYDKLKKRTKSLVREKKKLMVWVVSKKQKNLLIY